MPEGGLIYSSALPALQLQWPKNFPRVQVLSLLPHTTPKVSILNTHLYYYPPNTYHF